MHECVYVCVLCIYLPVPRKWFVLVVCHATSQAGGGVDPLPSLERENYRGQSSSSSSSAGPTPYTGLMGITQI